MGGSGSELGGTAVYGTLAVTGIATFSSVGVGTSAPRCAVDFSEAGIGLGTVGQQRRYLIPPSITSSQRVGLTTISGGLIYNVTTQSFEGYRGNQWGSLVSGINTTGTSFFTNINSSGVVTATTFVGDGSGLTGVVGSGSGVVVKNGGSTVGTAGTVDFGTGLSVSPISSGIVTVTVSNFDGGTEYSYGSITNTISSTNAVGIHSTLATSSYRSVEYTIQASEGSNYHVTKIVALHNGTSAYHTEYSSVYNNVGVSTYDVDLSGGNIRLLATPTTASSTTFKITYNAIKVW